MAFKWIVDPKDVFPQGMENYTRTVFTSGRKVAESRAEAMVQWARMNAPWTDRTGAARRGLHATVEQSPQVIAEITISHDPSLIYPPFLELANAGKFAIIAPTIDMWGPIFMRDMQNMMNLGLVARED